MLIFHKSYNASNIFDSSFKNKREKYVAKKLKKQKSMKKNYKSACKRKPRIICRKVLEKGDVKKCIVKKKLSNKNKKFLNTLGLKVKQQ